MKLVEKKEFLVETFDPEYETFAIYIASFTNFDLDVHLFYKSQLAGLIQKKTFAIIPCILVSKSKIVAIAIIGFLLLDKLGKV